MNGKEQIESVLALVDVKQIETPQYNVSIKKFNAIADVYRRLMYFVSMSIFNNEKASMDEKKEAYDIVTAIAKQPDRYNYDSVNKSAVEVTKKACDEVKAQHEALYRYVPWNENNERELRVAVQQTKKNIIKKNLKEMLLIIEHCKDYPDIFLNSALREGHFEEQIQKLQEHFREIEERVWNESQAQTSETIVEESETVEAVTAEPTEKPRKSFWQKLFHRI